MRVSKFILFIFTISLFAHAAFAMSARDLRAKWQNVPPVPSKEGGAMLSIGDEQLAYRISGIMLQNLGDIGGRTTPLHQYNYQRLSNWFFLLDEYDQRSNYIPALAAYYFGSTQKPEQLDGLIEYLQMVGLKPHPQKWRWLGQAAYLARYGQKDYDKAMQLALMLSSLPNTELPVWAKQMPALIASDRGDKEAAYEMLIGILKEDVENLHPNEVNVIVETICERILDEMQASVHPLCNPEK